MTKEKQDDAELTEWARSVTNGIEDSAVFVSIVSPTLFSMEPVTDWVPIVQLGLAVVLDKPIVFLVPSGTMIPESIRRLATVIEQFDPNDKQSFDDASRRLLTRIKAITGAFPA